MYNKQSYQQIKEDVNYVIDCNIIFFKCDINKKKNIGAQRPFQQYISYMVEVTGVPGDIHRPVASHWSCIEDTSP
jgi:hypothetical protein